MKKLCMFILVAFVSTIAIMAETESNVTLNGSQSSFEKIIPNQGSISYQNASYYSIGNDNYNLGHDVYRSYWYYSLNSIPSNAQITGVYVTITNNNQNAYSLSLTSVLSQSTNAGDNWTAIGNGSSLHQNVQYNSDMFSSAAIKDLIQNNLSNRSIIIGALSQTEATDESISQMTMSLYITYNVPVYFTVHNDMDGNTGGHIGVGINTSPSNATSPFSTTTYAGNTAYIQTYDDNTCNGYPYVFNDSEAPSNKSDLIKQGGGTQHDFYNSPSGSYTFQQNDNNSVFVAYLKKVCSATFQGKVSVAYNNNQYNYNESGNLGIVTNNSFTATASTYYTSSDWIQKTFLNWTWPGGSSNNTSITQTVTDNITYTANYSGIADASPMNIHFTSIDGQDITLGWTEHPCPYVTQYQIWRKVKGGSTSLVGTVNRGTTSFTDGMYMQNNYNGSKSLFYTVKAYYLPPNTTNGTWNDPGYYNISGDLDLKPKSQSQYMSVAQEIPTEYNMENYPNPFNPTTAINYQIPKDGFVTLKIYDMLGREVATLVNDNKTAGYYKVNFDAGRLTSGVYIYTIKSNDFFLSKKMLLMK
jgi:Secretion system C-terminal sorting domain